MADILNLQIPSPTFGGSTGGWLEAAETEEKYVMTWTNSNKSSAPEANENPSGEKLVECTGPK